MTDVHSHLLIVDDDPVLVEALRELLIQRFPDATVETCTSSKVSLERIANIDYDAILSDVRMPGVDGIALLERAHELRPETPILLLTGMGDYTLAVKALRAGAFDFIAKPIDVDYLAAAVTRALRVREIVARRTMELRAASNVKDDFLATLSHELRTPLTAILGWSKLLLRGGLDDIATRNAIESIERNATNQTRLVDDLLDVSRITSGRLAVTTMPVDMGVIVTATLDGLTPLLRTRSIHVERSIGDRLVVLGDSVRLQQVVANLVSNAIKFSPVGATIRVSVERSNGSVKLVVADSGVGIASDELPKIFQRFHQVDSSLARAHNGLGVGLAIAKHIVDLHGGNISASSEGANRGATFVVTLLAVDQSSQKPSDAPRTPPADLEGVRILLVEDDPDARALMRFTLERSGARVTDVDSAANAYEALDGGGCFDALLCDVSMPQEDGYSFIRRVRAKGERVRAAAVTAHARPEDVQRAMAAGFDLHLSKPIDPRDLVATVVALGARPNTPM